MTKTIRQPLVAALRVSALALAMGAGLAVAQPGPAAGPGAMPPPGMMRGAGMGPGMHAGGPGMGPMLHERQLDQVGASAEQKARIREIFKAAHADVAKTHETRRDLHQQMARLMAAPVVDAAAAEALRQQLSAGHDQASKRMLQAMIDAGAVLTPEQRQKMAENVARRQELRERHRREMRALDAPRG